MARQSQSLYDRHITIFSPEGKLFQVEYAYRAIRGCNLTAIALRGETCACVAVQRKVPLQQTTASQQQDRLLDLSSVTSLHKVTETTGAALLGIPGDCRSMLYRARDIASKFEFERGYHVPAHVLAAKIGNLNQLYTQHAYMRLHACVGVFIAIDEETKQPVILKFDPAGWFAGYKGCAFGTKEQEGTGALEKTVKNKSLASTEEVIEQTIAVLQSVISVDFKASEIQVGIVTVDDPLFRYLTEEEIDSYLTKIAERD